MSSFLFVVVVLTREMLLVDAEDEEVRGHGCGGGGRRCGCCHPRVDDNEMRMERVHGAKQLSDVLVSGTRVCQLLCDDGKGPTGN